MTMRKTTMTFVAAFGALAAAAAIVSGATAATPEERAKCEEMFKKMGTAAPHGYGAEKTGAPSAMSAEHVRCREILGDKATSGGKHQDGTHHDDDKKYGLWRCFRCTPS